MGPDITIARLCEAGVTVSEDTLNGPEGLNIFLRAQGDAVTRLDRKEPNLNEVRPCGYDNVPGPWGGNLQRFLAGQWAFWLLLRAD